MESPTRPSSTDLAGCMASPSWFPLQRGAHSGPFHLLRRSCDRLERTRSWRDLLKRLLKEGRRSVYASSKPLQFGYDADSYSKNFDDGHGRWNERSDRLRQLRAS